VYDINVFSFSSVTNAIAEEEGEKSSREKGEGKREEKKRSQMPGLCAVSFVQGSLT